MEQFHSSSRISFVVPLTLNTWTSWRCRSIIFVWACSSSICRFFNWSRKRKPFFERSLDVLVLLVRLHLDDRSCDELEWELDDSVHFESNEFLALNVRFVLEHLRIFRWFDKVSPLIMFSLPLRFEHEWYWHFSQPRTSQRTLFLMQISIDHELRPLISPVSIFDFAQIIHRVRFEFVLNFDSMCSFALKSNNRSTSIAFPRLTDRIR